MTEASAQSAARRYAAALYPWAGAGDRFLRQGYREALPVAAQIQRAAALGVLDGIEMVYPFQVNEETAAEVRRQLQDAGLALAALGTTISSQRQYGKGALTAREPAVRRAAIAQVKAGIDLCAALGGERIYFFLGQDGCDYALEIDYEDAWNWLVEGIAEIAAHRRDMMICLEYKPYEPRRHIFLNDVGTALYLVGQVGAENVGVLLDTGHALMAGENLGESIWLLHRAGRLSHVHFNDNHRLFDDDMIVGAVHFMPFVEAIYWLRRVSYGGWRSLDLFPYREDPDAAVAESILFLRRLDRLIDELGMETITQLIHQDDGVRALREINRHILRND